MDRYEVTNRQFKAFVDGGGYGKREYWKQPFVGTGREISWEEAQAQFRDATGRPGPASWELGSFPEGREDFPVDGVSWYEAAAYAEFAGKSLPTVYHWYRAAGIGQLFRDPAPREFRREGPGAGREVPGLEPVRKLRHGRKRQGVVLERDGWPPVHPGRFLDRRELPVPRSGCAGRIRPVTGLRVPLRPVHGAALRSR